MNVDMRKLWAGKYYGPQIVPGARNRSLALGVRLTPRSVVTRVARAMQE